MTGRRCDCGSQQTEWLGLEKVEILIELFRESPEDYPIGFDPYAHRTTGGWYCKRCGSAWTDLEPHRRVKWTKEEIEYHFPVHGLTPKDVYEAYLDGRSNGKYSHTYWMNPIKRTNLVTICDFFFALKRVKRGFKLKHFFNLIEDMLPRYHQDTNQNWNGYSLIFMRGILVGVCTKLKLERDTTHRGYKFVKMWRL